MTDSAPIQNLGLHKTEAYSQHEKLKHQHMNWITTENLIIWMILVSSFCSAYMEAKFPVIAFNMLID